MTLDLDSYAARTEAFLAEIGLEHHLHFSGQKQGYEVEAIYERHAGLFSHAAVEGLRALAANGDPAGADRHRRIAYLLEFAVGGLIGRACAAEEAELAQREAALTVEVAARQVPYRSVPVEIANEADAARRAEIEAATIAILESDLNPLHVAVLERSHELIAELGWPSYADAYAELREIDLEGLAAQARSFLAASERSYSEVVDAQMTETLGFGLGRVRRSDLPRLMRAPALDGVFPGERLIASFEQTMAGLGLDLAAQPNVILDTEQRPTKTARAYCAPVRVPAEVYLVVPRFGGREDFRGLFHEGGHAEHYGNVAESLAVEFRHLGDNSVTESFAFLLEHLTEDPVWLEQVLGVNPDPVVAHARAMKLYFLRRYASKLVYELELHGPGADLAAMPARYSELLGAATEIESPRAQWVADVDGGFYVAAYIRAWALEARWRAHLRARFGERWFSEPRAGEWLRGLWAQGQRLRANELLADELGEQLRFDSLAGELA